MDTEPLKIEEVQAPATGTRKAKVIYDYDAADSSELSLLADEVSSLVIGQILYLSSSALFSESKFS